MDESGAGSKTTTAPAPDESQPEAGAKAESVAPASEAARQATSERQPEPAPESEGVGSELPKEPESVAPAQSQPVPELPEPAPAPFIPSPELIGGPIIEVANLRFRDDRVEILSATPRAPIPRVDVMSVTFEQGPATEEPRREMAWLAVTLLVGTLALIGAIQDGGTFAWAIALGCFAVSVPLIRNRMQRVTVLQIETTSDTRRFPLDDLMTPAEIEVLANRLRELPNWPIRTPPSS